MSKSSTLHIRLDPEIREELARLAIESGETLSNLVRRVLANHRSLPDKPTRRPVAPK